MPSIRTLIQRYTHILLSAIILICCAFGIFGGVLPAVSRIMQMYAAMQDMSQQSDLLQEKLRLLADFDEQTLRSQLETVISAVPSDKSLPTVFSTVEGLAAQTQVGVVSMNITGDTTLATDSAKKVSSQEKQIGTHVIPFSVSIEGPLYAIQDFIAQAPRVRRLLRIHTFSMSFPQDDRLITVNIKMDAFYEPSLTTIGKASAKLPVLTADHMNTIDTLSQFPLANIAQTELPPPLIGPSKTNPFSP